MNKEEKKYNQILDKKEMSKEEAEKIIDEMYHDKIKVYGEGNVVHVDLIGTVKFTNLEFASVRILREEIWLQGEVEKRLKEIDSLYKMMSVKDDEIEQMKEDYQILKDDIEGHRIAYVDTPEFEENYISKDKIEEKIKELESHIWKDGYMTKFDRYAIHYLKELLGE